MKIFVVSLPDCTERRAKIQKQLNNLNLEFEFFDAIRGADYYNNSEYFDRPHSLSYEHRLMKPGEVGCALSHVMIYKQIVEQNLPYALILEDDAILSSDLPKMLNTLIPLIKQNDLITLERCDIYKKHSAISLFDKYFLVKPRLVKYGSMCQTAGYIVTLEAAKKMYTINFPVFAPADSWEAYVKVINFRGIIPSRTIISQDMSFDSTIVNGTRNTSGKKTARGLLFYAFYTRTAFGRFLKEVYKKIRDFPPKK